MCVGVPLKSNMTAPVLTLACRNSIIAGVAKINSRQSVLCLWKNIFNKRNDSIEPSTIESMDLSIDTAIFQYDLGDISKHPKIELDKRCDEDTVRLTLIDRNRILRLELLSENKGYRLLFANETMNDKNISFTAFHEGFGDIGKSEGELDWIMAHIGRSSSSLTLRNSKLQEIDAMELSSAPTFILFVTMDLMLVIDEKDDLSVKLNRRSPQKNVAKLIYRMMFVL